VAFSFLSYSNKAWLIWSESNTVWRV